jgi:Subtilase family
MNTIFTSTLAEKSGHEKLSAPTLDPLFYWAELVNFRGFLQAGNTSIRVAIELTSPGSGVALVQAEKDLWLQIAPRYLADLSDKTKGRLFLTARVKVSKLEALARMPGVLRVKPAFLAGQRSDKPLELWLGGLNSEALRPSLVLGMQSAMANGDSSAVKGAEQVRAMQAATKSKASSRKSFPDGSDAPLIGVIDFGCAFAHPHLQKQATGKNRSATRIAWLWDQGRSAERPDGHSSWPWRRPSELAYGREASAADLDALAKGIRTAALQAKVSGGLTAARIEEACYVAAEMPELLDSWSHGTAVLGVAAAWPHTHIAPEELADAAAKADIVFVQLPKSAVDDQSGGWVTGYLLDGIEYILAKALGRHAVINVSIGSYAGSHDGASLLETALALYAKRSDVTLVLAAGNGAGRKGHAVAKIEPGASEPLKWVLPADDPTQSFLELWYERPADDRLPSFDLKHSAAGPINCNQAAAAPITRSGNPSQAIGAFVHLPLGNPGTRSGMVLVALAPTLSLDDVAATTELTAPAGTWTITVTNPSNHTLSIHAYVERDEVGASRRSSRPDSILSVPGGSAWTLSDEGTLTAQSTAKGVISVGSYVLDSSLLPAARPRMAASSSRGGARVGGRVDVDVLAPGAERIDGLDRGLVVLPNFSGPLRQPGTDAVGQAVRLQGTSLATPCVVRQAYNQLFGSRAPGPSPKPTSPLVLNAEQVQRRRASATSIFNEIQMFPSGLQPEQVDGGL